MNIDGINFGSDDYYNEFYDGEFDLVDDAVISYQEEGNEWFDDSFLHFCIVVVKKKYFLICLDFFLNISPTKLNCLVKPH